MTSKGLSMTRRGEISMNTSLTTASQVGQGQTIDLNVGPAHQQKPPGGQNWESALQYGVTTALAKTQYEPT